MNTGLANLQWDHQLFWSFYWTGPQVILRVDSMGSLLISVKDFNGVKDYFGVLQYQDYIETLPVFLKIELWGQGKFILLCEQQFWMEISTRPWIIFD